MIRLNVLLRFKPDATLRVGQLAEDKHQIYFQYDQDVLTKNLWLSPYKLPLSPDLFKHEDRAFGSVFGLFDDSLPDGWGLLLTDVSTIARWTPRQMKTPPRCQSEGYNDK